MSIPTPDVKQTSLSFISDTLTQERGEVTSFHDFATRRNQILEYAKHAVRQRFPISNTRYILDVEGLQYDKNTPYTLKEQKEAILQDRSLSRKLQGRWILKDAVTGAVIERGNRRTIANIPYLTDRGTFIRNGNEQVLINQFRLIPNVYSRQSEDGMLESHVNIRQGSGSTFKVSMDPKTAEFNILAKGRKIKLYPVMQALGTPDSLLEDVWGKDILSKNKGGGTGLPAITSAIETLVPRHLRTEAELANAPQIEMDDADKEAEEMPSTPVPDVGLLHKSFEAMELDPDATMTTLGQKHSNVSPALFLDITKKILGISRGEVETDDRDSMEFQRLYGPHNYIAERIVKDPGNVIRNALWKVTNKGNLSGLSSGLLNKHVDSLFNTSGLSQSIEEINPMDSLDQAYRVSRMGEGGIASLDAVPEEARNVQPTYRGYVDPVRSPESRKVGVDMRLAQGTRYGQDGKVYQQFINARTGKAEAVDSVTASRSVVAFPGVMDKPGKFVPAMIAGKGMKYVPRSEVDYVIESGQDMFSISSNMVPLASGIKAMRMLTGSKMAAQALPLVNREAPLVSTMGKDGKPILETIAAHMGRVSSDVGGVVKAVRSDRIEVQSADGTVHKYEMYDNFPFSRKTYVRNIPVVKAGQRVTKGAVLATSNYTDSKTGDPALGVNLRIAYLPYKGMLHEDAVVVSESAAKKLTSEHLYQASIKQDEGLDVGKSKYVSLFPGKFLGTQYKTIDDNGVVKPGTVVKTGDPLILGVKTQTGRPGTMGRRLTKDSVVVWDYSDTGVVTDVAQTKDGWKVYVRANSPMQVADKLAGFFGNKGVIGAIVPDAQMPHDSKGKPFEILLNPVGIVSRTNPAQIIESVLGKIASKTGKRYVLPGFMDASFVDFATQELAKNKISDTDDIYDPITGRKIPKVFNGVSYFYKLQHTAEAKSGGQAFTGYSVDEQPVTGGDRSKRLGNMEVAALVSHGAKNILTEAKLIRGQKNDDYWRDLRLGRTPTAPKQSFIYQKFLDSIRASGINVAEDRNRINIFAMTSQDVTDLTGGREIQTADTFDPKQFKPIEGGLFDERMTGGAEGNRFAYIKLDEPIPNPVMEDSLRRILKLKQAEYADLIAGRKDYKGLHGGKAMMKMLSDIKIKDETRAALEEVKTTSRSKRDDAIKRLRALQSLEEHKVNPSDFMLDRIPVIPPRFRPIVVSDDMNMAADANLLYRELIFARDDLREAKETLPDSHLAESREKLYHSYKTLVGLADPDNIELREKNVGGILKHIFGKGSPKYGIYQRKMVGGSVDLSGRAPITPDPSLKLNQVGLPENRAWNLYEPFIVRYLTRHGYKATDAVKAVVDKTADATAAMHHVIKERPVLINRAPTMHKYGIMAAWPVLVKGDALKIPPHIVGPFGADFDGDTMSIHVPVTDKAVHDSIHKMMPERNLFGARDFRLLYKPSQEYVQGAYLATRHQKSGAPRTFDNVEDAVKAYRVGSLDVNDPIRIKTRV